MSRILSALPGLNDNRYCRCENCGKIIAEIIDEGMVPAFEECYRSGNVPVPNFGWLCSQNCALEFERKYEVAFAKTKEGKVDYYLDGL